MMLLRNNARWPGFRCHREEVIVTLIEAKTLLVMLALATAGSKLAGDALGAAGYVGGFLGVFAVPAALVWCIAALDRRIKLWPCSDFPCSCTERSSFNPESDDVYGFIHRCSCGAAFVRRGPRVFRLRAGRMHPYLHWKKMHGWLPCSGPLVAPPYR